MAIEVQLFDGTILEFPDGTSRDVIDRTAKQVTAQKQQVAPTPKEEPGIMSQIAGIPKEFVKGVGSGLVQAVGGLGALPYAAARYAMPEIKPFEETAFGKTITQAEKALAPSDEGYITQLVGGLGSFASMFGPQAVLRGVGTTGRLAAGLAPKAATPFALAQTGGLGVEEARQRAAIARAEGTQVTPGEELAALATGVPIGLTELLPVEKLFRGLDTGLTEGFKFNIANLVKRALQQFGIEGAQEVASGLMQDLTAKGIYNPNLQVGQSMFDEMTVGGGVGAIAQTGLDILFKRRIQDAYSRTQRKKVEDEVLKRAEEARAAQEKQIATTKEQLGIKEGETLALPAPAKEIEAKEEIDPLQNPLGMFKQDQLQEGYVQAVNKMRDDQGMAKVKSLSIEDIADAGAPQEEIDRLIAGRLSEQGVDVAKGLDLGLTMKDVQNAAVERNIDTATPGFTDFLRRTTGSEGKMSPVQTLAAFEALSKLPKAEELQVLPEGTNATRFTQEQYDKTVRSIKDLFPETNRLGRAQVIQEIKDYSGLENDRDAQSLLQAAIRNGEFTTVSTRNFLTLDAEGKQVGIAYPTRKSAERAAKARGLSVKESTSIDISIPDEGQALPGGPDIRRGEFKEGEVPEAFEIKSDQAVLATANTEEEAAAKAERLQALRENKANGILGQIKSIDTNIAKSQQKLESMEADGKADTLEYRQLAAKIAANNANLEKQKQRLNAQAEQYQAPLTVTPKGVKPVSRTGYTLFEQGKPTATFPTQQAAEQAAITRLDDETLQKVASLGRFQKGLMPKRLAAMAKEEMDRRAGKAPASIAVKPAEGRTVKEAGEKLADLGIFTPEFKKKVDELEKKLRPVMDKLGLKDLRLNIVRAIQTPMGEADGSYAEKLVTIALNADNPIRTLRHEAIHALKELGAFTDAQWKVLEKMAKENWLGKYGIQQRYKGLTQAEQIEEAIADAFSDFDQTKPPPGLVGALFNKIKKFFEAMGNAMRGMGFQTAEDVFANLEKGVKLPEGVTPAGGIKYAKKEEPKITGTGKIIGAPPGKSSEEDRKKLVREMAKLLETDFSMYEQSKDWYERSGAAIRDITRGDPEFMERVVRLMALYSQSNAVGGNTTATIDSIYQLATGETAYAGRFPNVTAERIPAILKAKTMDDSLPGVDDKLMNFYRNLHDATFETDTFEDASTIDRWMMRLFGYPHTDDQEVGGASGLSKTQYAYARDLVRRIAEANQKRTGELLKPRQVQAILWTYVKNKTDYDSLPKDKKKDFVPTTVDFTDYIIRATANITWESRPSTSLPIIPGIHNAPRKAQEAFNRAVRAVFVDPRNGEDRVFKLLGGEQLYSSQFSAGAYDNQIAPNIITKLVLRKADGQYLTTAADKYAAIIGYVTKQDAVPWYRADPKASGKRASKAIRITPSVEVDQDFEEALFKHLNTEMPGIGFTRIDNSFDFVNYRDENGKPGIPDNKYFGNLKKALESFPQDVTFNEFEFRAESGWISNNWKEDPDGKGYLARFGSGELSDIQATIDGWSKDYDRIAEDFGREYGWSKSTKLSLRPSTGGGIVLGEKQPGAISTVGVHYGKEPNLSSLSGSKYGTGIKGAEARRLSESPDPRIKKRVYFYLTEEGAPLPPAEAGLGVDVYTQKFDNILTPGDEMQAILEKANRDMNDFESGIVDAGYDGYAVPSMGMMVILNNDTPVNYQGKKDEVDPKKIKYSLKQSDSFSMDDLPKIESGAIDSSATYVLPKGIRLFHGANKERADEIKKSGRILQARPSVKTGGGLMTEGNLIWFGDEDIATGHSRQEIDIMSATLKGKKEPGEVFETVTEKPYKLIGRTYRLNQNQADIVSDALQLPGYKRMKEGETISQAAYRAHDTSPVTPSYKIGEGRMSAPYPIILKALGYDGYFDSSGISIPTEKGIRLGEQGKPMERFSLKDSIDPDTATAIERTTTSRQEEGFVERVLGAISPEARARFRAGIVNKYEGIERLTIKKAEAFGDQELLADQSAIAAALFSDRAAGVAASSFRNGVPVYEKGYTNVSDLNGTVKGLIPILEPLMKYNDPYIFQMFQYYAATKRGKRLDAEGREKLFTPDDVKRGQALESQYPEFKQVFDEYQKYNQGLVKFMKDTGVISDKEAQVWTQNWDYIPFYRQMEGEDTVGPKVFSAISGVAKPKKLKGGEAPLADFTETVVRNARAAIEAGMKNVAASRTVRDVVAMGLGREVSAKEAVGTDIMTVKENGLTKYYQVDDPLLVESVKGLNLPQLPFLDILSKPAEVLRNLVTKDPGFMLANLMRDSVQAWVTTGQKMTPVLDTFKQYGAALANMSSEARALAQAGLFTGYDFSGDVKATAREVEKELRKRSGTRTVTETALWPVTKVWEALEKGSTASDVATRAEVYKRVLKETGNEAEAMYQAMEVLNFSRRGSSSMIRVLTAMIPFMNARIQGLDVLYRAGFGKMATQNREIQQKAFAVRSLYILGLSSLYWALASDTEEYKTAEPEVRDNYWIVGSVRIPIPFEIGTVFKVFPERILEYWFGQDTGKDLKESIFRNVTSTLAFNPIPQAVLPMIENVANYSFFTGQPIVGKGMEDVAPKYQATTGTSLLAKEVGEATGYSPIKIDNLIRGYTGTLGTYAVMLIDAISRGEGDPTKATMKAEQLPVIKRFFASEKGTGTITAYYDLKQQVDQATRTINYLERTGNIEDLRSYYQDKGAKLIAIKPLIQAMDKDMTSLRELRQSVLISKMEPDRKREVLDKIRNAEVNLTSRIQFIKKQVS